MEETFNSDDLKARYEKRVSFVDQFGRQFEMRRLKPAEEIKVRTMVGPEVCRDGHSLGTYMIAGAICGKDGQPLHFPKNRAELDWAVNLLDNEGLEAAVKVMPELRPDLVRETEDAEGNGQGPN